MSTKTVSVNKLPTKTRGQKTLQMMTRCIPIYLMALPGMIYLFIIFALACAALWLRARLPTV